MTWHDELGDLQHTCPVAMEGGRVRRQRVRRRPARRPPQVRERHRAADGRNQRGDVLWRVPGGFDQADRSAERKPFRWTSLPDIALVNRPEVVKTGLGKERRVERVVWMMVRKDDVGDLLR